MSATKTFEVTLPIALAQEVEARVASGEYKSVSDLIRDSLEEPVGYDAEVEHWLREEVVPTYDALQEGRSHVISIEEAKRQLDDYMSRSQNRDTVSNSQARRTDR